VQVINAEIDEILHEEKQVITNVKNGIDTLVVDNSLAPEIYRIENYLAQYRIDLILLIDLDYSDNFESYAFKVTEDTHSMDDPVRTSSSGTGTNPIHSQGADAWVRGNGYYISKMNVFSFPQFLGSEHLLISLDSAFTD